MKRRRLLAGLFVLLSFAVATTAAEIIARAIEPPSGEEGNSTPVRDSTIGWLPRPGVVHATTSEYSVEYNVNDLNMNDRAITPEDTRLDRRVLALGDSHTFAVGVSRDQSWPLVLDIDVFGGEGPRTGRVFNGGVAAYSLGQYLQRYRMLHAILNPQVVLVGVSTATDLFDLLPPRLGGFVYGGDAPRDYFDLDESGRLIEQHFSGPTPGAAGPAKSSGLRLRTWLRHSALYRRVQNSMFAMRLATSIRLPGGDPIWEGPEAVLRRDLTSREQFQWKLAEAILRELVHEAATDHASVAIVVIPYLPEVYDDVWQATFGRSNEYDRFAGSRRLQDIATRIGADFVDTTPALTRAARESHTWLHFRNDKHPTPAGQRVIAEAIAPYLRTRLAQIPPRSGIQPTH